MPLRLIAEPDVNRTRARVAAFVLARGLIRTELKPSAFLLGSCDRGRENDAAN